MEKRAPLGICDLCGGPIPPYMGPYTTKGRPRLYCSTLCRSTANSRHGAPKRSRKAKERVARGEWKNPSPALGGDEEAIRQWRAHSAAGLSAERKREVEEGSWRNPALDEEARLKLSRPRTHDDNPVLHAAIEKLARGMSVSDLAPEEREAHRAYRRRLRQGRQEEAREYDRQRYKRLMSTPEGREQIRRRWQRQNARRAAKRQKP